MDLKGKKIVIYFYPNYACVVDTVKQKMDIRKQIKTRHIVLTRKTYKCDKKGL